MTGSLPWVVWLGVGACTVALACFALPLLAPRPVRLPLDRRRPPRQEEATALSGATAAATSLIGRVLSRRGWSRTLAVALEQAGVKLAPQDAALFLVAAVLVGGALGVVLGGVVVGLLLAVLVPVLAKVWLGSRARKRQRDFADQLDDSLQLMASSLRAGHSLLQALASVASEAEEPTSEEFARIINETRVGRQLGSALEEAARRMQSEDFVWVIQAIAINREVGGNLADVLDGVSETIRERNQIRRQVKALAAEGKLSAVVLMLLPFGIAGFLLMSNPAYMVKFTESFAGYAMIFVAVVLLVVGGLWLRKTVQVTF
ncbi:tight adherence protein B [Friedmanniella luteola]|uniref:Tight adherence protein B n=1 Tax=Friedmanniella luteola TaxID=546871 RepID=A0A1H1X916_9ACTN|nr:type II secretion system F family protein [Friedmanniella luteola]SDT05692.1 tight adherence protein B [Friedmanniella luteola]